MRHFLAVLMVCSFFIHPIYGDTIVFEDSSTVEGTIIFEFITEVYIRTSRGAVRFDRPGIEKIIYSENKLVSGQDISLNLKDSQVLNGKYVSHNDKSLSINVFGSDVIIPTTDITNLNQIIPNDSPLILGKNESEGFYNIATLSYVNTLKSILDTDYEGKGREFSFYRDKLTKEMKILGNYEALYNLRLNSIRAHINYLIENGTLDLIGPPKDRLQHIVEINFNNYLFHKYGVCEIDDFYVAYHDQPRSEQRKQFTVIFGNQWDQYSDFAKELLGSDIDTWYKNNRKSIRKNIAVF